ncbi:MAG: hypothetical protein HPY53_00530 [Brevinematales bacterium]|nr:hypothetical protein [Brevinematales bacterium]
MRYILPVYFILGVFLMSCQSASVPKTPENPGEGQPVSDKAPDPNPAVHIVEGQTVNIHGINVKIERIVEAFMQTGNGFSEKTVVNVILKKDSQSVKWEAGYGSVTNLFGYTFKIKYCATGTSDWKSFADFVVTPLQK